jgi:hypothetical protein
MEETRGLARQVERPRISGGFGLPMQITEPLLAILAQFFEQSMEELAGLPNQSLSRPVRWKTLLLLMQTLGPRLVKVEQLSERSTEDITG